MPFTQHRKMMVDHFLWLETHAPEGYARGALVVYRADPDCPCPDILKDIKAEKARRQSLLSSPDKPLL